MAAKAKKKTTKKTGKKTGCGTAMKDWEWVDLDDQSRMALYGDHTNRQGLFMNGTISIRRPPTILSPTLPHPTLGGAGDRVPWTLTRVCMYVCM